MAKKKKQSTQTSETTPAPASSSSGPKVPELKCDELGLPVTQPWRQQAKERRARGG